MAQDRNIFDAVRDLVTAPGRVGPAFYDTLEAVIGKRAFSDTWNTLFNPSNVNEDALASFSDRYTNLQSGWAKFFVDTATDPFTLVSGSMTAASKFHPEMLNNMGFVNGAEALGVGAEGPTAIGKTWFQDMAPAFRWMRTYGSMLKDQGFQLAERAELLSNKRYANALNPKIAELNDILSDFTHEEWKQSAVRVSKGLEAKPVALSDKELSTVQRWKANIYDDTWDRTGTIQRLDNSGEWAAGDPQPIGYQSAYYTHTFNDQGMISFEPKAIHDAMDKNPIYQQMVATGKITPLPFSPDDSMSLAKRQQAIHAWMQQPGAAKINNPYLLKREALPIPDAQFDATHELDPEVTSRQRYLPRMARTQALMTPISIEDAQFLHGKVIENGVDLNEIYDLHKQIRQAYDAEGMGPRVAALRDQVMGLYRQLPPEQYSLAYQITDEARKMIPGYDPLVGPEIKGQPFGTLFDPQAKLKAQTHYEWWRTLIGKKNVDDTVFSTMYATAMSHLSPHITSELVDTLNNVGAKFGNANFGSDVIDHVTQNSDSFTARQLEGKLVGYVTGNLLGLRPASVLINMTQTPVMTLPHIGFGNTIAGYEEAVPRLTRAYRDAYVGWKSAQGLSEVPMTFDRALSDAFKVHMPEFVQAGLPTDFESLARNFYAGLDHEGNIDIDNFTKSIMIPFQGAENLNRVATFYGSRQMLLNKLKVNPSAFGYHMAEVPLDQLAHDIGLHAAGIVNETQFVPTAGGMTPLQYNLGPIARQFWSYPLRLSNYIMDAGMRSAIDARAEPLAGALANTMGRQRSFLPYARYLAVMNGMVNFGRDVMGMELGRRVMEGAFPLPLNDDAPFGFLPVSPIPGAVIGAVSSAIKGKLDKGTFMEVPIAGAIPVPKAFVPAGQAISQGARIMNQVIGGISTDAQGNPVDQYDARAMIANVLGLKTTESARDEMKTKRLLVVDQKVKDYRHQLAVAMSNGDQESINQVQQAYGEEFKGAPLLSVAPNDIQRVVQQSKASRLQRVAASVTAVSRNIVDPNLDPAGWFGPAEYRQAFHTPVFVDRN